MSEVEILSEIRHTLEEIRSILFLVNQDALQRIKNDLLPKDSVKERIYMLCDGANTTKSIAQILGKDEPTIRATLSVLRRQGLISTSTRNGQQVHSQIF